MTAPAHATTRLRCASSAHKNGAPPLGDVALGYYRLVTVAARLPDPPDGKIWLRCPDQNCRLWNGFERIDGDA